MVANKTKYGWVRQSQINKLPTQNVYLTQRAGLGINLTEELDE